MTPRLRRRALAVAATVSLVAAAAIWLFRPDMEIQMAFFGRAGVILAAAWLAFDDVQRLPGWILLLLPIVVILIARSPRLLWLLAPLLVLWMVLQRLSLRR